MDYVSVIIYTGICSSKVQFHKADKSTPSSSAPPGGRWTRICRGTNHCTDHTESLASHHPVFHKGRKPPYSGTAYRTPSH